MTQDGSLDPVWMKLNRAQHHQQVMIETWNQVATSPDLAFKVENADSEGWNRLTFQKIPPLPLELSFIWGDMLSNARAALDYLVWQLVLRNRETPGRHNAWPVVTEEKGWRRAILSSLRGVSDEGLELILRHQPFRLTDSSLAPRCHPLAIIDALNNINKHRLPQRPKVTVAAMSPTLDFGEEPLLPPYPKLSLEIPGDIPLETGQVFAKIRVDPPRAFKVLDMSDLVAAFSYADGIPDCPMVDPVGVVKEVVETFAHLFERAH